MAEDDQETVIKVIDAMLAKQRMAAVDEPPVMSLEEVAGEMTAMRAARRTKDAN